MRLLPDPELNDLLMMQRVMLPADYVDIIWSFRDRLNPPAPRRKPYPFQLRSTAAPDNVVLMADQPAAKKRKVGRKS